MQTLRRRLALENAALLSEHDNAAAISNSTTSTAVGTNTSGTSTSGTTGGMNRVPSFYTSRSLVNLSGLNVADPAPVVVVGAGSHSSTSHSSSAGSSVGYSSNATSTNTGSGMAGSAVDLNTAIGEAKKALERQAEMSGSGASSLRRSNSYIDELEREDEVSRAVLRAIAEDRQQRGSRSRYVQSAREHMLADAGAGGNTSTTSISSGSSSTTPRVPSGGAINSSYTSTSTSGMHHVPTSPIDLPSPSMIAAITSNNPAITTPYEAAVATASLTPTMGYRRVHTFQEQLSDYDFYSISAQGNGTGTSGTNNGGSGSGYYHNGHGTSTSNGAIASGGGTSGMIAMNRSDRGSFGSNSDLLMQQGDGKAYIVDQTDSAYISVMSREPSNTNLSAMQFVSIASGNSQTDLQRQQQQLQPGQSPATNIQK